jgi:hypothetical protein
MHIYHILKLLRIIVFGYRYRIISAPRIPIRASYTPPANMLRSLTPSGEFNFID